MGTVNSLVTLPLPLLLQLIGVTFAVQIDPYIRKEQRRIMLLIVALLLSLIVQDCLGSWLDVDGTKPFARTIVGIYGYSVRPLVIVLFFYIVGKRRKLWPAWLLIGLNTLIHLTAVFSPICFCIDADNHFCRGPLGYSCHIVSGILLAYLVLITVREYSRARKSETWINKDFSIHLKTNVALTDETKEQLLAVSMTGTNEAAKGFMDKIRDMISSVLLLKDAGPMLSMGLMGAGSSGAYRIDMEDHAWSLNKYRAEVENSRDKDGAAAEAWDELERSVVANLADEVRVGIQDSSVEITIFKTFTNRSEKGAE